MKKTLIFIFSIICIFAISFYIGVNISEDNTSEELAEVEEEENAETTNSEEEKISPNAIFTLKIYYNKCSHIKEESGAIPDELVNINREELENEYNDWKVEKFSKDEVVLIKNEDEWCGEHYVLREENGSIVVYSLDESGEEGLYMTTNIAVEYLPQTDKHALQKGIYIYGNKELNEILQDFE